MITNEVAVTISFAQQDDGTIYAALFEASVPPPDENPILEVAGALSVSVAVEVLLRAVGLDTKLINHPDGGDNK